MSSFQNRYKTQAFGFGNQNERRTIRAEKYVNQRKMVRNKTFNENRNILESSLKATLTREPEIPTAVESRMARLLKWKMDRDRRKKLEQAKKKRPFIVGKVSHKIYSPIANNEHVTACKSTKLKVLSDPPKRITRATEKRLMLKAQLNKINNIPMKTDNSVKNKQSNLSKRQEESFAPPGYEFKPPANLKRVPLFGRVTNSINDSFNITLTPLARVSRISRKSSVTNLSAQPINKTLNTSYTIEKEQDDDIQPINSILKTSYTIEEKHDDVNDENIDEDSIETVKLKLSSDDEKVFNSSNKHTSNSSSKNNNDDSSGNVNKKDKESNEKFSDSEKSRKFNDSKKKLNDSKKNKKLNVTEENGNFNDSKKNGILNDLEKNKKINDTEENEKFNNSKKNAKHNDSEKNKKLIDFEENEKFNNSVKNGSFNDSKKKLNGSKKNEKFNDTEENGNIDNCKKNGKLNGSEENEKFNNSMKKFNDSEKSKTLNDSNRSKKSNNFKENEDINQKLSNSYEDSELNITIAINSSKNKDVYDIAKDTSEKTKSLSNNDKSIFLSPYAVSSREKINARNEQQMKSGLNLNRTTNDYNPMKESVTKNVNVSVEEEERTAQYFEFLLNKEIERQNQLCEKWVKIKEEPGVTEDAQYHINQAIGQTNLLMNKKFVKFRNLISDCMTGQGEMLITCNDLQGFWDMMYIEVIDCNLRFQKLEQLRSRGWEEEQVIAINKPRARKKVAATKKVVHTKSNGIGAFLAKRKQNMVEGTQNNNDTKNPGISINETLSSKYEINQKSPDCKFRVLRKLQLSDTKKLESPLAMIKISQMCKTPEVRLSDTISYINLQQTPSKSILKHLKNSCTKSAHKVNFNDNLVSKNIDEIRNLDAVVTDIDNLSFDCVSHEIHAGRKLTFSDDSFEKPSNMSDDGRNFDTKKYANTNMCAQKTVPTINIVAATPLKESMLDCRSSTPSPSRKLIRQNIFCKDDGNLSLNNIVPTPLKEIVDNTDSNKSKQKLQKHVSVNKEQKTAEQQSDNIRVLRNRSIIPVNTPTPKKRYSRNVSMNAQEFEYKENKTPMIVKSKNLNRDDTLVHSEVDLHEAISDMNLEEKYGTRRSSRKSVKFSEKECSGCVEKLTFSMTPHVRRSRAQSTEKKRSIAIKESTDTTEKLPERVRRSRSRKA